jgi:hypothetical protein
LLGGAARREDIFGNLEDDGSRASGGRDAKRMSKDVGITTRGVQGKLLPARHAEDGPDTCLVQGFHQALRDETVSRDVFHCGQHWDAGLPHHGLRSQGPVGGVGPEGNRHGIIQKIRN